MPETAVVAEVATSTVAASMLGGRRAFGRGTSILRYGTGSCEHRSTVDLHAFMCGEPEPGPYPAGRIAPAPPPRMSRRHARVNDAPAPAPAAAESVPDQPRSYPVETALLQADRIALSLRGALERTAVPLAAAAAMSVATKAWNDFGFARLDDYARERLGRSGRWVRDLAALGEGLRSLPGLTAAMTGEDGGRPIGRVAALLVAKVASPESLDRWVASARTMSIRALRDAVRAARTRPPEGISAAEHHPAAAPRDVAVAPGDDDDAADRLLVRMMVPPPVLAAFDETVDLFRALEGGQATVASFVEALVAEASARRDDARGDDAPGTDRPAPVSGGDATWPSAPADADLRVLHSGPEVAATERALAASTANWRHLPEHVESSWALALAGITLARFRALEDEAGRGGAADLDRQLRALVEIENELEARLGAILADLGDRRAWPRLRFAGVGHYGEERLGLSRTAAEDRARLARDLRRFPQLREAYGAGRLGRESAALVVRLLRDAPFGGGPDGAASGKNPATALEAAWVARGSESTVKRMRDEARALGRYRVLGPRLARAQSGVGEPSDLGVACGPGVACCPGAPVGHAPLDDAAWHASLRREPGLARRRLGLFGALTLSSPDVFQAMPHEADTFLRLRLPLDLGRQFLAVVDAERRRISAAADAIPWDADLGPEAGPGAGAHPRAHGGSSWLAARMFSMRCRRVPAWVGLMALLEDFVATWDCEDDMPRRPGDEIYVRDGWRCAAPGCTSRRNLEDHHLRYRSRGGDDDHGNRICLCRFHHQRGEHGGLASCRGRAPVGVVWRLGRRDAAPAWYRNERRIDEPAPSRDGRPRRAMD